MIYLSLILGGEDDYDVDMENHNDHNDNYNDYCQKPNTIITFFDRCRIFFQGF